MQTTITNLVDAACGTLGGFDIGTIGANSLITLIIQTQFLLQQELQ